MEEQAAAMPGVDKAPGSDVREVSSQDQSNSTPTLRLSGTVPIDDIGAGNAAYLFGWVAFKRGLAGLGRWLGVRRYARLVIERDRCTYRQDLDILGLDARTSEETIPWHSISSVHVAEVSSTWPVIVGAMVLLVGATWSLLRIAEGILGRDAGILAKGFGVLALCLAADMALAFLASKLLPRRWQVVLHLTNGEKRTLETSSRQIEPIRVTLTRRITDRDR